MCDHSEHETRQTLDGEIICLTCGQTIYRYETDENGDFTTRLEQIKQEPNPEIDLFDDNACDLEEVFEDFVIREELLEVFEKAHIPRCIIDRVMKMYNDQSSTEFGKVSFKNKKMELLCYATFVIMIEEKIPRTPTELAYFFDVNPQSIWKMQKYYNNNASISPHDMLERYFDILNIHFKLLSDCPPIIEKLKQLSGVKPETITACTLYILGKKYQMKALTYALLGKTCAVSTSSIRNLYKRYAMHL